MAIGAPWHVPKPVIQHLVPGTGTCYYRILNKTELQHDSTSHKRLVTIFRHSDAYTLRCCRNVSNVSAPRGDVGFLVHRRSWSG